jgi:multidrug resistance efflux pump
MMLLAVWLSVRDWPQLSAHAGRLITEHFLAVFVAGMLVVFAHEFAHGLTCKVFGGRATEVGVLMVFYVLPALYCNVTGIHMIPQRNRRLWVIAAGVYWQLMVGAAGLLVWFAVAPETLLADVALAFALGSLVDVLFNANPLIKLDGYYFLSQWLRLPNLMDRSRAFWRGLWRRLLTGEREEKNCTPRERWIYALHGLLSVVYSTGLMIVILVYAGGWLMNTFYLFGLLLTVGVAVLFARKPLKAFCSYAFRRLAAFTEPFRQTRRRIVPVGLVAIVIAVLVMPWSASVGNYGQLVALPDRETIIRAPEAATLVQLSVKPGDQLAVGAVVGRLGNLDVEEQIAQVQTELARVQSDYDRLLGEMRVRGETALRAGVTLQQRQTVFAELDAEQRQIRARQSVESNETSWQSPAPRSIRISNSLHETSPTYPAALAALQSETDAQRALWEEAIKQRDRLRQLHAQGLVPRSELDAQEARAATLAGSLEAARQRLNAALIEHRRLHMATAAEVRLAETDAGTERLTIEKLSGELRGARELIASLESRRDLLLRKRGQFDLTTGRAGVVFGEELPRLTGQFFQKGAEICRVADTLQLLVRIQVPEREIGDIRVGHTVRLKARAFPDQTFRGAVTKIGGESESDASGQTVYRVELTIENSEGLLRPGMTAFARIDFDRQMIGRILLHKIKQTLRPELWML